MPSKRASTVRVEYVTVFLYTPPVALSDSNVWYNVDEYNIYIIYTDKVSLKIHIQPLKIAQNFAFANAQIGS